jgi:hypothetical protein
MLPDPARGWGEAVDFEVNCAGKMCANTAIQGTARIFCLSTSFPSWATNSNHDHPLFNDLNDLDFGSKIILGVAAFRA